FWFEFVEIGPDRAARAGRLQRVAGAAVGGEDFLAFRGQGPFAAARFFFGHAFFFGFGTTGFFFGPAFFGFFFRRFFFRRFFCRRFFFRRAGFFAARRFR